LAGLVFNKQQGAGLIFDIHIF